MVAVVVKNTDNCIAQFVVDTFTLATGKPPSKIELQKLLYFAHGTHLLWFGDPLLSGDFQAWKFGPVQPQIHRAYEPESNLRLATLGMTEAAVDPECKSVVDHVVNNLGGLGGLGAWKLVDLTHDRHGAWSKSFEPGVRNIVLPNTDILAEFEAREVATRIDVVLAEKADLMDLLAR